MQSRAARPKLVGSMRALTGASALIHVIGLAAIGGGIAAEELSGINTAWLIAVASLPTLIFGLAWELTRRRSNAAADNAETDRT